ncbi:hypothetical protein [Acinetobacter sp.]|uniref:hypothetical protein n=1 Tax=Acinetobacter sp. TaxID=472 RepID=UPI002FC7EB79
MNPELEFAIVTELAGDRVAVKTENLFLAAQLISIGFRINESSTFNLAIRDEDHRLSVIDILIELGALFSSGRDWSPEELVRYYVELGEINKKFKVISWRNPHGYTIR